MVIASRLQPLVTSAKADFQDGFAAQSTRFRPRIKLGQAFRGMTDQRPKESLAIPSTHASYGPLASDCGAFTLLLLAACSVTVRPGAPSAAPPVESQAPLLATATAVAPTAPDMLERLARECRRYGNCEEPTNWDAIVLALEQRPLQLPDLDEGDACPEPLIRSVEGYLYQVMGEGPVYGLPYLSVVSVNWSALYTHDGWYWNKVVWTRDPQYTGPIVIRGRQLNGPATLRFQWIREGNPSPELAHSSLHVPAYTTGNRLDTRGSGWWEEFMTYVVVRAPGCYGVQIDGVGFSTTIVFAVPAP